MRRPATQRYGPDALICILDVYGGGGDRILVIAKSM